MVEPMMENNKRDDPRFQPAWDLLLQRDLIQESDLDKFEWIEKYSPKFRLLVEEKQKEIKELIKDPLLLKETFRKWLYEENEETIH